MGRFLEIVAGAEAVRKESRMPRVTILTEKELRACVALDLEAVAIVEQAFAALATGGVVMPPILSMAIPAHHGEVDVKTAFVPGLDSFAIKVSPGFFDNPKRGLPSLNGLMMLFESRDRPGQGRAPRQRFPDRRADRRRRRRGGEAPRAEAVRTAGVIGAGVQAELQIRALKLVRDFSELLVWARDPAKAEAYAAKMRQALGISVRVAARRPKRWCGRPTSSSPRRRRASRSSAPIGCIPACTSRRWAPTRPTRASSTRQSSRAGRFVCDRNSQSILLGEMRAAAAAGLIAADHQADELGEICAGLKPGRTRRDGRDDLRPDRHRRPGYRDRHARLPRGARARGLGTVIES